MNSASSTSQRTVRVLLSLLIAIFLAVVVIQVLFGQEVVELLAADLSGSSKDVSQEEALPGSQLQYSVVLSNSGNLPALNVSLTDTLSTDLSYISGTLSVTGGGLYGESGGIITWTGAVNNNAEVLINFGALITDSAAVGTVVTNTAMIKYNGSSIELPAVTTVVSDTSDTDWSLYLPIIQEQPPVIMLNAIGRPSSANAWTLSWSTSDPVGTTSYEVQEDFDPGFPSPSIYDVGASELSFDRQPAPTTDNIYYYRVRAVGSFGLGNWSQTRVQIANYRDDFTNPGSGWTMRRQDTDHIENQTRYQNGEYVHEMDSSWDYLISGPLTQIPAPPYRIEMSARHVEPGNLNSYGMVFGGDWDGQTPCPTPDYSSCFNNYYRLNIIWFGNDVDDPMLRMILKRIDFHDPRNNHGRGETIIDEINARVNFPPDSHQRWAVEVYPDGVIKVFVNGEFLAETVDTTYIDRPYFGSFSSTDEYAGLEAHFDWFEVTALP